MEKVKVLLVEDDPNLGLIMQEYLELKGIYEVTLCQDGQEGLECFSANSFDLCILDVMMPIKDGFTLGKEIKALKPEMPLIYTTAKTLMADKKQAFDIGADDYLTKPFSIEELEMRISAVLRRAQAALFESMKSMPSVVTIGQYVFDTKAQTLKEKEGDAQKLSTKETELLTLFCSKKNEVVTRQEALLSVWQDDSYFNSRSMDVFMSKLRKYLKNDPQVELLNVHGRGFKLVAP